jgi:hypothetical protein
VVGLELKLRVATAAVMTHTTRPVALALAPAPAPALVMTARVLVEMIMTPRAVRAADSVRALQIDTLCPIH